MTRSGLVGPSGNLRRWSVHAFPLGTAPSETTLKGIDGALETIRVDLQRGLQGVVVQRIAGGGNNDTRVLVRQGNTAIKIEKSPVARGSAHQPDLRRVSATVEDTFGFAEMRVVAFEDL